jgi:hypothetical protein
MGQCNNNQYWRNTFMAPAMDLPNTMESGAPAGACLAPRMDLPNHVDNRAGGVHLMDKITIAERLIIGAFATVYHGGNTTPSLATASYKGPRFLRAVEVTPYGDNATASATASGSQVVVHFSGSIEIRSQEGFELNSACGEWPPFVHGYIRLLNVDWQGGVARGYQRRLSRATAALSRWRRDHSSTRWVCAIFIETRHALTSSAPCTRGTMGCR